MTSEEIRNSIFYKAFSVAGLDGWYLEFGVFRGNTFSVAYKAFECILNEYRGGQWDSGLGNDDPKNTMQVFCDNAWNQMRFVAFDSFQGLPDITSPVDAHYPVFRKGAYACDMDTFLRNVQHQGVSTEKIICVPGFFEQTLNLDTATRIGLERISVLHIDSDLYASALLALDYCTPFFRDGTIVIFDEWFQFRGSPFLGEQRAFREWKLRNPEWTVSEYGTHGVWTKAFILSREP